jgi:hypothetical protein
MKKIIIVIIAIVTFLLAIISYSVFYPDKFINGGVSDGINLELRKFSFNNPEYVDYEMGTNADKYDIRFIKLNRANNLFWDYDSSTTINAILPSYKLEAFKKELKSQNNNSVQQIIQNSENIKIDKYEVLPIDTYEQKKFKQSFTAPTRQNSIHHDMSAFKLLKRGMMYKEFANEIGSSDFGLAPSEFHPIDFREEFVIGSNKVSFAFLTFKEGYPTIDQESLSFKLVDIGFVTHGKEKVIVPVNPDGTYNWEAVKDKID